MTDMTATLPAIPVELPIDLKKAKDLGPDQARFLVDMYYEIQKNRIRVNNRMKALAKDDKPTELMQHFFDSYQAQEEIIRKALGRWAKGSDLGAWALKTTGIGPVIAAGLLAHIDITRAPAPGNIWSFAGLSPVQKWEKGQKRPWNAALKLLCWKMGQSFLKSCNREKSLYGRIYKERKQMEVDANERGDFAGQAKSVLDTKNIGKTTDAYAAYSTGKLPKAHLDARARRYAVKMFLSHYWESAWRLHNPGKEPPRPWVIEHGGHKDYIEPEVPFGK